MVIIVVDSPQPVSAQTPQHGSASERRATDVQTSATMTLESCNEDDILKLLKDLIHAQGAATGSSSSVGMRPNGAGTASLNPFARLTRSVSGFLQDAQEKKTDVDWTSITLTTVCVLGGIEVYHVTSTHHETLSTVLLHTRQNMLQNSWMRDVVIVLGAVDDLPVVLKENIESMFPKSKSFLRVCPFVVNALRLYSAVQIMR